MVFFTYPNIFIKEIQCKRRAKLCITLYLSHSEEENHKKCCFNTKLQSYDDPNDRVYYLASILSRRNKV